MFHVRLVGLAVALLCMAGGGRIVSAQMVDTSSTITRAGAVALLVEARPFFYSRVDQFARHMPPISLFEDAERTEWYAPYLEAAFEAGLIIGNRERLFRPAKPLTEREAVELALRFRSLDRPSLAVDIDRSRIASDSATSLTALALREGIVVPLPFHPDAQISREHFFVLMRSLRITNPETIVIRSLPLPTPVAAPLPVTATAAVIAPPPVAAQPTQFKPIAAAPSFATPPRFVATQPRPIAYPSQPTQTPARQPTATLPASTLSFAISMPTLGVRDLPISHPSDPFTKDGLLAPLKNGVGHLFSYPGNGGTILVYGHSSSYAWDVSNYTKIFRQINKLNTGDRIYVTYNGTQHTYQVTRKQTVPAADMSAYQNGNGEELILYTCWPPDTIRERYLVFARPIEAVAIR